jgi:predicted MFS family arabinose efflux permease
VPLLLAGPSFNMSQGKIALFALAGGSGAIAAPLAGRAADKGWTQAATVFAIVAVLCAFSAAHLAQEGTAVALAVLVASAILLDFGMTANLTLGQRAIFVLGAEYRSRLNALYMAAFFLGGAAGSAVGAWAYALGGWTWATWFGAALPLAALLYFATDRHYFR